MVMSWLAGTSRITVEEPSGYSMRSSETTVLLPIPICVMISDWLRKDALL